MRNDLQDKRRSLQAPWGKHFQGSIEGKCLSWQKPTSERAVQFHTLQPLQNSCDRHSSARKYLMLGRVAQRLLFQVPRIAACSVKNSAHSCSGFTAWPRLCIRQPCWLQSSDIDRPSFLNGFLSQGTDRGDAAKSHHVFAQSESAEITTTKLNSCDFCCLHLFLASSQLETMSMKHKVDKN